MAPPKCDFSALFQLSAPWRLPQGWATLPKTILAGSQSVNSLFFLTLNGLFKVFGTAIHYIFFVVPSVAPGFLLVHPCPQHHFLTAFPTPPITGAAMSFSGFFRASSPRCPSEEDNAVSSVSWAGTERFYAKKTATAAGDPLWEARAQAALPEA